MAFGKFWDRAYYRTFDSNDIVQIGSFTFDYDQVLSNATIELIVVGGSITTERLRMNVVPSFGHSTPIYQSDWFDLSDISNIDTNWTGRIRFDFDNEHIDSDITYFFELESDNYTRNDDTFYLGAKLDHREPVYSTITNGINDVPIWVTFYGTF